RRAPGGLEREHPDRDVEEPRELRAVTVAIGRPGVELGLELFQDGHRAAQAFGSPSRRTGDLVASRREARRLLPKWNGPRREAVHETSHLVQQRILVLIRRHHANETRAPRRYSVVPFEGD